MHAAALGLTKIVTFAGERDDYLAILRAASLGWVIASGDAAAFACLDFMAMKVAVLAERGPLAATYVADGITGLLLPPTRRPRDGCGARAPARARRSADSDGRRPAARGWLASLPRRRCSTPSSMPPSVAADRSRWKKR